MLLFELLFAVSIAVVLTFILAYPLGRRGPGPIDGLLFFFAILFFAVWAGGVWVRPFGPVAWGVPWVGFLAIGITFALVLAASASPRRPAPIVSPRGENDVEPVVLAVTLGVFFYAALVVLLIAAIFHYLI